MGVTKSGLKKTMEPFLIEKDGMTFLNKDLVDEASKTILSHYNSVYTNIEESDIGRDKFMVGNIGKAKIGKPIYEIYID